MIISIGIDVFFLKRINLKNNKKFTKKYLYEEKMNLNNRYLAKIFSIKESVVKSIGTGFRFGFYLKKIVLNNNFFGRPICINDINKNTKIMVTISHEKDILVTIVFIFKFI